MILLLPSVAFGTQFGQIPVTQVIGTPSITNDINITLTLGGTPTDAVLKPFSLTLGWTGTLAASRGGTGGTLGAEPPLGNPSTNGYVLSSTTGGVRSWIPPATGGGGGTVTDFSAGTLSPLFTTSVATSTTTPALSFSLSSAAADTWFGRIGTLGAPAFNSAGALTKTDDTNVTLTLGGTPTTSLLKATSLTLGWTGTLAIARGGTGASSAPTALSNLGGEPALGNPGTSGFVLSSTTGGVRSWVAQSGGGGSGTVTTLTQVAPIVLTPNPTTTTGTIGLDVGVDHAFTAAQSITLTNATTAAVNDMFTLDHESSGTPAGGFGTGIKFKLESSTTVGQDAAQLAVRWNNATHANRDSAMDVLLENNGAGAISKVATFGPKGELAVGTTSSLVGLTGVISADSGYAVAGTKPTQGRFLLAVNATDKYIDSNYGMPTAVGTAGKILQWSGSNVVSSTPLWPTTASTSGKVVKSNGTDLVMSTETYAVPGTSGNVMTSDGTNWTSATPATGAVSSITGTSPIVVSPTTGAAVASLNVGVDHAFTASQSISVTDAATSTVVTPLTLGHNSSATPLAGFGTGLVTQAKDSTTNDIVIGSIRWLWTTPAHGNQSSSVLINADSGGTLDRTVGRFSGAGGLTIGPSTSTDQAAGVISAETGYRVQNLSATSGTILQGNGTNFIASTITWPTAASTSGKVVASNGTNFVTSTPTFPTGASATSGKIIKSDGTNWVASTETYAAPGTSGNVLTSDGTNWTSAASAGSITPAALTETDDTNVTLTLGGTPATALLQATSITVGWTGTLAVARGGIGAATVGANTVFNNNTGGTAAPNFTAMAALTAANDTNVTLTLGGTPATSLMKAVSVTAGWTGTLAVARGGSGRSDGDWPGVSTNSNAPAGTVGEYVTATASGVAMTTATAATITSISLTAGDWDVTGVIKYDTVASTTVTALYASVNTTTNVLGTDDVLARMKWSSWAPGATSVANIVAPVARISIASTTTVYMVGRADFATSTLSATGWIRARRVR